MNDRDNWSYPESAEAAKPAGNPEAIWRLVMAMKLNGLPKEAVNVGFLADFEVSQFNHYWSLSYADLCKGSRRHD